MKKENVTISFESEQLAALEFSLKKKNTSVQAQLEELLKCLYESEVPEPVRELPENWDFRRGLSSGHWQIWSAGSSLRSRTAAAPTAASPAIYIG